MQSLFDSVYEWRDEIIPESPEEAKQEARKARIKAGDLERRDKVARYLGVLRETLPAVIQPGWNAVGYVGGQIAVIEAGTYRSLHHRRSQADCFPVVYSVALRATVEH
jgi:hypothetical protein